MIIIYRFKYDAKISQITYGNNSIPDNLSIRNILINKIILRMIKNHILTSAITGILNPKNNQDQRALKNNWNRNRFLVISNVLTADMDIKMYKIGHTIPNTKPGGFKFDLLRFWYHISSAASPDDNPPKTKAMRTKRNIEYLLLNINLFIFFLET